jgi:hypothetical protein
MDDKIISKIDKSMTTGRIWRPLFIFFPPAAEVWYVMNFFMAVKQ